MPDDAQIAESWTIQRLLDWTRDYFARCGLESPRLCAELLLAHVLDCERLALYTRFDHHPLPAQRAAFRELVRQAAAQRPIAYLTGRKEFFSLSFEVTPDVLIPRPETELLVERGLALAAERDAAGAGLRVLDLGTGSGCIGISIAVHLPSARVTATDVSAAALEVARRNAARHGVADRMTFVLGDLFEPLAPSERFDVIVSNPPYVALADADSLPPGVREHEPHAALFAGPDGLDVIRRVIEGGAERLSPGGRLLLELGHDQARAVAGLLERSGWGEVRFHRDAGGHARVVQASRAVSKQALVA